MTSSVPNQTKTRLQRAEAAAYISEKANCSISRSTLARMASTGGGPKFSKFGARPIYDAADLDAWIASRTTEKVSVNAELRVA